MAPKNELVEAIANENRLSILQYIHTKPHYISEIVEHTKLSRPAVCFHLDVLEKANIVQSEYQVLERPHSPSGKAARFYSINTTKLSEAIEQMNAMVKSIGMKQAKP